MSYVKKFYNKLQFPGPYQRKNLEQFINPKDFYIEKPSFMFPVGPTKHPLHEGMRYTADTILKFERKMFDSVLELLPISENSV